MRISKSFLVLVAVLFIALGQGCGGGFPIPELPTKLVGHCIYENFFSKSMECKEYLGDWSVEDATNDCKGNSSNIVLEKKCGNEDSKRYGDCIFIIDKSKNKYARVELPGTDSERCGSVERGCEFFGGGSFLPTTVCGGKTNNGPTETLPVFQPPTYACKEPKAGEPKGKGPNGQVCTWSAIGGATEPGRNFEDYGSCNTVRTQRPYYPVPPHTLAKNDDARMKDDAYVKESNWVKSQVRASACVCCHTTGAPKGPSNWYLESGPNWINSMGPVGLAMGAGWISTVSFGAYSPEQNNGFTRASPVNVGFSAFPSTDDARIRKFFAAELKHRGKKQADFEDVKYGTNPLDAQYNYKPTDCKAGQTVEADGTIKWVGGDARYIFVLKAGSKNPGVPPNLDKPEGTLWRVDVSWKDGTPIASEKIKYGELPKGSTQVVPSEGKPTPLESGSKYYLYVLKDIAQPLTRCFFTAK